MMTSLPNSKAVPISRYLLLSDSIQLDFSSHCVVVPQAALWQLYAIASWFLHLKGKKKIKKNPLFPGPAQGGIEALKNLASLFRRCKVRCAACRVPGSYRRSGSHLCCLVLVQVIMCLRQRLVSDHNSVPNVELSRVLRLGYSTS